MDKNEFKSYKKRKYTSKEYPIRIEPIFKKSIDVQKFGRAIIALAIERSKKQDRQNRESKHFCKP